MEQLKILSNCGDGDTLYVGKPGNPPMFDWRWFPVVKVDCTENWGDGGPGYTWHVTLSVVSPEAAGEEGIRSALECIGMPTDQEYPELALVEALVSYGIHAPVWQEGGNNLRKLLASARKELALMRSFTFGFAMDKAINAIGDTGWDWVAGNIGANLRRSEG